MTEQLPEEEAEKSARDIEADDTASGDNRKPKEIGGRKGPDPTRYGDWEKAGRCIDF